MKKISFEKIWNGLLDILNEGDVIQTLSRKCPNEITKVDNDAIQVMSRDLPSLWPLYQGFNTLATKTIHLRSF